MDGIIETIIGLGSVTVVGFIWYAITQAGVKAPGVALHKKFVSLGTLTGRKLSEITAVCGEPNSISSIGNGKVLRQWQATGYTIALIFDSDGICQGVSSEISV